MTRVAAIIGLAISTMLAATLFWHISRERGALNQARAQQEEVVRHLQQIEQTLAALGRSTIVAANPQTSVCAPSAPHDNSTKDAAKADATSADRTVYEEALREGNAIVDRAIANGRACISGACDVVSVKQQTDICHSAAELTVIAKALFGKGVTELPTANSFVCGIGGVETQPTQVIFGFSTRVSTSKISVDSRAS